MNLPLQTLLTFFVTPYIHDFLTKKVKNVNFDIISMEDNFLTTLLRFW